MKRKQNRMEKIPELEKIVKKLGFWDFLEKKANDGGALEGKKNTDVEEWVDAVVVEGEATRKAPTGSRSSQAECDLFVVEVGVHQKDTEECQESFGLIKAPPQKR